MSFAHYCPICGEGTDDPVIAGAAGPGRKQHRCKPRSIAGIDGARNSEVRELLERRSYGSRLEEGFSMLADDEQ